MRKERDKEADIPRIYGKYVLMLAIGDLVEIRDGAKKRGGRALRVET